MDSNSTSQERANAQIAEANRLQAAGELEASIPLYRDAIRLFAPYASFGLVVGDSLRRLGRPVEAVIEYEQVVAAHPDHDQAWHSLGEVLYELGWIEDAKRAMLAAQAVEANRPYTTDASELVAALTAADGLEAKSEVVFDLVYTTDPNGIAALHGFMVEVAGEADLSSYGVDLWGALANTLVRFGMAEFTDWYSDGPHPDRDAIEADLRRYVTANPDGPTTLEPVYHTPPPRRPRRRGPPLWTRLRKRFGSTMGSDD